MNAKAAIENMSTPTIHRIAEKEPTPPTAQALAEEVVRQCVREQFHEQVRLYLVTVRNSAPSWDVHEQALSDLLLQFAAVLHPDIAKLEARCSEAMSDYDRVALTNAELRADLAGERAEADELREKLEMTQEALVRVEKNLSIMAPNGDARAIAAYAIEITTKEKQP